MKDTRSSTFLLRSLNRWRSSILLFFGRQQTIVSYKQDLLTIPHEIFIYTFLNIFRASYVKTQSFMTR